MKKLIFIISIGIMFTTVFLSGCNEENNKGKNPFIGTWEVDGPYNESWTFKEDNTLTHIFDQWTVEWLWEDNGSALCIAPFDNPTDPRCGSYEFSNNYNTCTWRLSESELILKRKQ